MHSHAVVMERQPPQKETANKANLTSKIRKCSHWCGDLISCYNSNYITSKQKIKNASNEQKHSEVFSNLYVQANYLVHNL